MNSTNSTTVHHLDRAILRALPEPVNTALLPAWAKGRRPMGQAVHTLLRIAERLPPRCAIEIGALHTPKQPGERFETLARLSIEADTFDANMQNALRLARGANAPGNRAPGNILWRPDPAAAHPFLLVDDLPLNRALDLALNVAALVIQTSVLSDGTLNCQMRLLADRPLPPAERPAAQQRLTQRLDSDPSSTAGDKWSRLPGFQSRKLAAWGQWTNLLLDSLDTRPPMPSQAILSLPALSPPWGGGTSDPLDSLEGLGSASSRAPEPPSRSLSLTGRKSMADYAREALAQPLPPAVAGQTGWRQEYANACQAVRAGLDADEIVDMLSCRALERSTEAAARKYAQSVLAVALKQAGGLLA